MVRFFYNVVQNILILLLWPFILLFVTAKAKYRYRFWVRCGFGLRRKTKSFKGRGLRFWVHAVSVGELSSVVSLVKALRNTYPNATLVVSTSTTAGAIYARKRLTGHVDAFIGFPYDHIFIVRYFLAWLRPSLFIQVETDFWPNILAEMKRAKVPSFLVNGRVSLRSYKQYERYPSLFLPLFNSFTCLGMQTSTDVKRMVEIGVSPDKVALPGNLKIDAAMPQAYDRSTKVSPFFPGRRMIVFGSTHPGEEEELAPILDSIKMAYPDVCFVVAPRDINRGKEVVRILEQHHVKACQRSLCSAIAPDVDCLVLDTMGELITYYEQSYLAFVGGSLQSFGGHNPLEPVAFGKPVLFGSHMEDFEDICAEMVQEKCAIQVTGRIMLGREICGLLKNKEQYEKLGQAGLDYIIKRQGVTKRHLDIIDRLLIASS